ncbi:hypothetical protein PVAND_011461 [Polypedilum vanderplanki]|uniref:Centrosome-associated zinc finger protein CP190 n=1 Tax=Polypedilum vanderplanki TaxID=319348 RepID=A0A9J6CJN4_POLVA|nr:hypothetical protein PVAND_011461 [Polypedilum vanderplanki]
MNRTSRDTLKSVKVDNWGQFFLQKLLSFFNKTDYCDLTLQFLDNSQLKVHRLVLSACTDYFNMLEQSCEMIEDILMMPSDLQADVIVPIVNFMYTGTLEFHYSMYEKLLKTSREMNMTVLSKLLEAHRQTSTTFPKTTQPVLLNKNATSSIRAQPKVFHQKTLPTKTVIYKQGQTIIKHVSPTKPNIPEPIQIVTRFQQEKNASRPSRFIVPEEIIPDSEATFEKISYESKPLQTASQLKKEEENSPFESLRRGYTNNKRAAASSSSEVTVSSPPAKKPNLDDIKAEAEAQSQRSAIMTDKNEPTSENDDDDDDDYDGDQYFDDEGSDDETLRNTKSSPSTVIKQTTKQITVSDSSGGNIDHAKILGEVLKKYPNLVKNPKNIKLKIMQKPSQSNSQQTTAIVRVLRQEPASGKVLTSTPQLRQPSSSSSQQPKKIDAKTMHELIKLGAENMKGPWLCLECGSNGKPISIPTYKKFRAHLINIHKQKIDPRICEHCGLKPAKRIELIQHQLIVHNINPPSDVQLFRCTTKGCVFVTQKEDILMTHKREVHKEFQQKCRYCSKVFNKEFLLHAHMRAVHRHMAKTDGVMEFSEDEEYEPSGGSAKTGNNQKIEIISNIEIAPAENIILESAVASQPSSEAESLSTVATGITTSLLVDNIDDQYNIEQQLAQVHGEYDEEKKEDVIGSGVIARLVAEDGTEMVLTPEQKEEILQQLQQQGATLSTDNVVMVLDQGKLNDEEQQMVMYSEEQQVVSSNENVITTTTTATTTTSNNVIKPEEIEKAEIVFQDDESAASHHQQQKHDDNKESGNDSQKTRSKLISELEDDWSDVGNSQEFSDNKELSDENNTRTKESRDVESNSDIKGILNDWSELDMADDKKSAKSLSIENKEAVSCTEKEESLDEHNENIIDNDKNVSTDVLEKESGSEETRNEKSKIITELLDEWNDL